MKRKLISLAAALCLLIVILDGKTALLGAQDGLDLCIRTVIPSLFPFFLLTAVLNETFHGAWLPGWLFGLPRGCNGLLVPMLLGGYPLGAQSAVCYYNRGTLKKAEASKLLTFCNQPGPSFLFGILGQKFGNLGTVWALWAILILGAMTAAFLAPPVAEAGVDSPAPKSLSPAAVIQTAIRAMASVCGWIILFRVGIAFADRWLLYLLPDWGKVLSIGLLELSNGCTMLDSVSSEGIRFLLAGVLLSLGGLCVTMQTASAAQGLSLKYYWFGKAIQCITVLVLSVGFLHVGWLVPLGWFCAIVFLRRPYLQNHHFRPFAHYAGKEEFNAAATVGAIIDRPAVKCSDFLNPMRKGTAFPHWIVHNFSACCGRSMIAPTIRKNSFTHSSLQNL